MTKEICQDCEKIFVGGKDAFLCPECRKKRVEKGKRKSREKKQALMQLKGERKV